MIKDVRPTIFTDFLEGHYSVSLETENTCPICHHKIEPVYLNSYSPDDSLFTVYAVLFCTHCHQPFLCHYKKLNNALTCTECFPKTFLKKEFSERVSKLSPNFVEIYNQALQAESSNLNQICGIGYRKAIEFLIKDYLIHITPQNSDVIKNATLGNCIASIDNPKIKTLAERATWLGNDETHYIRKHTERDTSDIKLFLDALVSFIDYELIFEEALSISKK